MATGVYIGAGGTSQKVRKIYLGVGNVAKKVKKGYIGVGGVAKLFFNSQPVLSIARQSITLSQADGSTCNIRGTVFNNRAILCGGRSSSQAKADTITTSLTKTTININQSAVYMTQCCKLPSYAILGGDYRFEGYSERKISLNSSFTASSFFFGSTHKGGSASQTSSYAIYVGTQKVAYDSDDEAYNENENNITVFNNSLTETDIAVSGLGRAYGAVSLGDIVVFCSGTGSTNTLRTINNSLTRSSSAGPSAILWGAGTAVGAYAMYPTSTSASISAKADMIIYAINSSRTYTAAYTENTYYRTKITASSTPDAAIFAGGGTGSTDESPQKRVIALDESFTDVRNGMELSYGTVSMQSCVLPFGSRTIFAGGGEVGPGVATSDFYNYIYVVTEQ